MSVLLLENGSHCSGANLPKGSSEAVNHLIQRPKVLVCVSTELLLPFASPIAIHG